MFTGIVEAAVPVRSLDLRDAGGRLLLEIPPAAPDGPFLARIGDSLAVSGC